MKILDDTDVQKHFNRAVIKSNREDVINSGSNIKQTSVKKLRKPVNIKDIMGTSATGFSR